MRRGGVSLPAVIEARRIGKTLTETKIEVPLENESFFVCKGYPSGSDLETLGDYICWSHGTTRPWRPVVTWLSGSAEDYMRVDVLLGTWLSIHAASLLSTRDRRPLTPQERFRLADMLWGSGPVQLDNVTEEDLRQLVPTRA